MILAMDGGGTKTQFLLSDAQGRIVAKWRSEGCNYLQIGLEKLTRIIAEGTMQLCQIVQSSPKAIQLAVLGIPAYGESQKDSQEIQQMVSRLLEIPILLSTMSNWLGPGPWRANLGLSFCPGQALWRTR